MTFKVGDRVRRIQREGGANSINVGDIVTVAKVETTAFPGHYYLFFKEKPGCLHAIRFELVTEGPSLDSLIETANKGLDAIQLLIKNHSTEVDKVRSSGAILPIIAGDFSIRVQKRMNLAFRVSEYNVTVENDMVRVGCKIFSKKELVPALSYLLIGDTPYTMVGLTGLARGVMYEGNHLSWSDVELLLNKLKETI